MKPLSQYLGVKLEVENTCNFVAIVQVFVQAKDVSELADASFQFSCFGELLLNVQHDLINLLSL